MKLYHINNGKPNLIHVGTRSRVFSIFTETNSICNDIMQNKKKTLTNSLIHQRSRSLEENSRPPSMVAINAR